MLKSVIFDMDGLMFDTERIYDRAWVAEGAKMGINITDSVLKAMRGVNMQQTKIVFVNEYKSCADYDVLCERVHNYVRESLAQNVPHRPGLLLLLNYLQQKEITMAVASSSDTALVHALLASAGVSQFFNVVVGGDMVQNSKPHPEIFLKAALALGTPIEECAVLEDSFNGVRAGYSAGAFTIMVPDIDEPTSEIRALCSAVVPSLADVVNLSQLL